MTSELRTAVATGRKGAGAPPPLLKPASVKPNPTPVAPEFDSLGVSKVQCENAINALLAHVKTIQQKREQDDLLGESEEKVFLTVSLKRPAKREVHMPIRLPLPHPVIDPRVSPVTIFVKDPQREYKDLLESSKISFISRVVGLDKLRTKHKTFEAKRLLLKEADLFLVDDRVVIDVGKSLGKMWRDAKKQPIPIAITRKDLKAELERAVSSTYLQINTGSSLAIKFGSASLHTPSELLANLLALLPLLAVRLPNGGWSNVQSLHLKTSTSTSLPLFNTSLDDAGLFSGPTEDDVQGRAAAKAKKEVAEREREEKLKVKEQRRLERSATKEGKGREEKKGKGTKRKAEDAAGEEEATKGEDAIVVDEEPVVAAVGETKAPKAKKSKKAAVEEEPAPVVVEEPVVEARPAKKSKKAAVVEVEAEVEPVVVPKAKKSKKVDAAAAVEGKVAKPKRSKA